MKFLVIFAAVLAATVARPADEQIVSVSQDTDGNYKLKYAIAGISRVEQGDPKGNIIGAFSYIDPHGIVRKTEFTAGVHGFNAVGSDIPLPVVDTPEVAAAKAHHLSLLREAELAPKVVEVKVAEIPTVKTVPVPLLQVGAIPETPEVLAARAEHLAAHEAASKTIV
ncbi:flexible cuticle protein 12-like [Photinus pyralis]|uniref:flexible cuticle protein 12-like n=1 Tax=Photinus pyralis TaxID=7054 RepID=UPI001267615D|nr:flexible cuticle protein 12-like [Photinus pyralis]